MLLIKDVQTAPCIDQYMTCVISNQGTWGDCNRDKKRCCFHWELKLLTEFGFKTKIICQWNY